MLIQIAVFLLDVVTGLLAGLCLLRAYLGWLRVPLGRQSGNPLGPFILGLTDWLVLRLRRLLPNSRRIDGASCLSAYLVALTKGLLISALGAAPLAPVLLLWAGFEVVQLILSGLFGLTVLAVLLSWFQSNSPMALLVDRMIEPVLQPIRRVVPLVGGLDLSPLVLLVILQVLDMVFRSLRWSL